MVKLNNNAETENQRPQRPREPQQQLKEKAKLDVIKGTLKRADREAKELMMLKARKAEEVAGLAAGEIKSLLAAVYNPTRESIRGFTIVDRIQGRLLPQLDVLALMWDYVEEIAMYRYDWKKYEDAHPDEPVPKVPNLIEEFTYKTALWQRSVGGKAMERGIDLSLAEIESGGNEDQDYYGPSGIEEK